MRIGVIGTGITGLSAAWALRETADVVVYEKAGRLGGHSNTVTVDYAGQSIPVDTGFIVYNPLNYPNLIALFEHLGVKTEASDMSFSVFGGEGPEWSSDVPFGVFAHKRSLFSPSHWRMISDMQRFNARAKADAEARRGEDRTLRDYVAELGMSQTFLDRYLIPMGAAIWSTPEGEMLDYPAASFLRFFNNHKLLHADRPVWRTVSGGSQRYVARFAEILGDRLHLDRAAVSVQSDTSFMQSGPSGVTVTDSAGQTERFDHVILACHSDESLALLADPTPEERELLGAVRYGANVAYLHRDVSLMPKRRAAWASWNVRKGRDDAPVTLTYWMSRLQNIDRAYPLFVTLNPAEPPDPALTFQRIDYAHPLFTRAAMAAQRLFNRVQGQRGLWFAGAWQGYGFHEDGLRAGLRAALALGGRVPWAFVDDDIERVARPAAPVPAAALAVAGA
jgi:predicted NAD/FAD-binding protein